MPRKNCLAGMTRRNIVMDSADWRRALEIGSRAGAIPTCRSEIIRLAVKRGLDVIERGMTAAEVAHEAALASLDEKGEDVAIPAGAPVLQDGPTASEDVPFWGLEAEKGE